MFTIVAMPLRELFAASGDARLGAEIQHTLETMLTEELGRDGRWDESPRPEAADEAWIADDVGPYPIYALRAAAAWLELHDDLEGFEIGEEPWAHEALIEVIEGDHSQRFHQLLFSESWVAAFVPVDFETVYILAYDGDGGDDDEDEDDEERDDDDDTTGSQETDETADDDDDDDDDDDLVLALGSLSALRGELDVLGRALGMAPFTGVDAFDGNVEFDAETDPLAAARLAWLVLAAQAHIAAERGLPLLLVEEIGDGDEDDVDEDDDAEGRVSGGAVDALMDDVGIDDWDELE